MCGAVEYAVADAFEFALFCHCSMCRRSTGSAFKPLAGIPRSELKLVRGDEALLIVGEESGHDARCGRCGSLLYSVVRDGTFVHVAMGTLVDEPSTRPTMHIFVASKAGWYQINDDLPRYQKFPEG
jgi:hypothetical protein